MSDAVSEQIAALRERLDLIWANHEREHKAHEQSHAREYQSNQKALDTAAILAKENKADANEWRASMTDREARFSTKDDIRAILGRLDSIERADLLTAERERQRVADEAEDKRQSERRVARSQWTVALVVGLLATFGALVVNLMIRLASGA